MFSTLKNQSPAIAWALFCLIICFLPLGKVGESHLFFAGFDKLTHTGLLFVLAVFIFSGLIRTKGTSTLPASSYLRVFILLFLFGAFIELLQWKVFTYRSADLNDLFCDVLGTSMAIFCLLTLNYALQTSKK